MDYFELLPRSQKEAILSIPIPSIDLTKRLDKEIHNKLVNLVDTIIGINKKLNNEKNPDSATMLRRQVEVLDGEVDRLALLAWAL